MKTTSETTSRRLALLPVEEQGRHDRPVIRRYKLARVLDDLGATLAGIAEPHRAVPAPAQGLRSP